MKLLLLLVSTVALVCVLSPHSVQAVCDVQNLKVIHVEYPVTYANLNCAMYYMAPATVAPTYYYVFYTNNSNIINILDAAAAANLTVRVSGDAASCPTSGLLRNGGLIKKVWRDLFF